MGMPVNELYSYLRITVNGNVTLAQPSPTCAFGGFICTTAGNFNLQDAAGNDIISAIGVVVGQQIFPGIACPAGVKIILSGGAIGTAFYLA